MVYGRNITSNSERLVREVLKTCRTQLREKRIVRTAADLKPEELE